MRLLLPLALAVFSGCGVKTDPVPYIYVYPQKAQPAAQTAGPTRPVTPEAGGFRSVTPGGTGPKSATPGAGGVTQ